MQDLEGVRMARARATVVCLICTPSALRPAAIELWVQYSYSYKIMYAHNIIYMGSYLYVLVITAEAIS